MRSRNIFALIILVFLLAFTAQIALAQKGEGLSGSKLEIISPKEGEILIGDEILLNLRFSAEGGNHAHIWLDEASPSKNNAETLENPGPFLFKEVKPGEHTIIVELFDKDHRALDPEQKITLKLKTKSAADVTPAEIAQALKQIKPAKNANENTNQKSVTDCLDGSNGTDCAKKPNKSPLLMIIGIAGLIIVGGGIGFLIFRSKK